MRLTRLILAGVLACFRSFAVARKLSVGHKPAVAAYTLAVVHKQTVVVAVGVIAAVYTQGESQTWAAAGMLVHRSAVACMLVHRSVVAGMLVRRSVVARILVAVGVLVAVVAAVPR